MTSRNQIHQDQDQSSQNYNGVPPNTIRLVPTGNTLPVLLPPEVERLIAIGAATASQRKLDAIDDREAALQHFRECVQATLPVEIHSYINYDEATFTVQDTDRVIFICVPGLCEVRTLWRRNAGETAWNLGSWHGPVKAHGPTFAIVPHRHAIRGEWRYATTLAEALHAAREWRYEQANEAAMNALKRRAQQAEQAAAVSQVGRSLDAVLLDEAARKQPHGPITLTGTVAVTPSTTPGTAASEATPARADNPISIAELREAARVDLALSRANFKLLQSIVAAVEFLAQQEANRKRSVVTVIDQPVIDQTVIDQMGATQDDAA